MDLTYSPEQLLLADGVARYLQQTRPFSARQAMLAGGSTWSREAWEHFARQGLLGLARSKQDGGLGGSIVDVVAVAERFGAALVGEPFLSTIVLGGSVLAAARDHHDARAVLAASIEGGAVVAFAHDEHADGTSCAALETRASEVDGSVVVSGEKILVLDGGDADHLVVSARLDGEAVLLLLDPAADGVRREAFRTIDGRGAARIRLEDAHVACVLHRSADDVVAAAIADGIVYLAAEIVGAMDALLAATAAYARTRHQFGVPIGTFQAIAHRLADMKIACVTARATLVYVTALREAGRATPRDLAVLKAQTGRLGRNVGESAVQVHGGVGMTDELPVGHLLKRIVSNDLLLGDAEHHLRSLGRPRLG